MRRLFLMSFLLLSSCVSTPQRFECDNSTCFPDLNLVLTQSFIDSEDNSFILGGYLYGDDQEKALKDATILLPGTTDGTLTDANGYFKLAGDDADETIVFSHAGYKQLRLKVADLVLQHQIEVRP